LIFFILLSFIPFGAGPRCVILAHASLKTFITMPPLWIFGLLFLGLVGYLINDRSHLLDVLGRVLTPLLVICVTIMVISAFIHGETDPPTASNSELFINSVFEGYNTQDLLSSLFFSSSLIILMKGAIHSKKEMIVTMLKGSVIGIVLLTTLYVLLIAASSLHSDILIGHSGIDLVSILAKHTLGSRFGLVAGLAVALACLTTAVALIMSFSQFLSTHVLQKRYSFLALPISLLSVFLTSLLEFEGIMGIISPVMKIVYPIILIVVIRYLLDLFLTYRAHKIHAHSK
jgi:LIVCS family branched-chain amino acid:cation transporter